MAKKKARVVYRTKKKGKFRRAAKKAMPFAGLLGAGAYGALRQKVSMALAQYTNKIPAGNISDEVGMMITLYAVDKFAGNKVPMLRDITKAGKLIEAARIGEAIATGQLGGFGGAQSPGTNAQVIG